MAQTIFWAWQSDLDERVCHYFIRDVLAAVCGELSKELKLEESERADVDHDTKDVPGTPEVFATILRKIRAASAFMADVTPVARTESGKPCANPNVMIELGHALSNLKSEQVFIIANSFWYEQSDELPFDLRHRRRPILYHLPPGADAAARKSASEALVKSLKKAIGKALALDQLTAQSFNDAATRPDDPSVWVLTDERLKHRDFDSNSGPETGIAILERKPRSYIRIIPTGWRQSEPRREALLKLPYHLQFFAPGSAREGNGGPNSLGLLRYWVADRLGEKQAISAAQIFRATGECWAFDGNVGDLYNGRKLLAVSAIVKGWAAFLQTSVGLLEHWEAKTPIKVSVGVVGMTDYNWPSRTGHRLAYDDAMSFSDVQRLWDEETQRAFLISACAPLWDAFGWPAPTEEELGNWIRPSSID